MMHPLEIEAERQYRKIRESKAVVHSLPTRFKARLLKTIARVSEKSFRRGFQQGAHVIARAKGDADRSIMLSDIYDWRFASNALEAAVIPPPMGVGRMKIHEPMMMVQYDDEVTEAILHAIRDEGENAEDGDAEASAASQPTATPVLPGDKPKRIKRVQLLGGVKVSDAVVPKEWVVVENAAGCTVTERRVAIGECNAVFCWLDSPDSLGRLAEAGYAAAFGKHVYIGLLEGMFADLYAEELAATWSFVTEVPVGTYSSPDEMVGHVAASWARKEIIPPRVTRKRVVKVLPGPPVDPKDCFVYLLREIPSGRLKIGTTQDMAKRIDQLQVGNPDQLEYVGWLQGGFSLEAELHERFASHHITGEWFNPAREIIAYFYQNSEGRKG